MTAPAAPLASADRPVTRLFEQYRDGEIKLAALRLAISKLVPDCEPRSERIRLLVGVLGAPKRLVLLRLERAAKVLEGEP